MFSLETYKIVHLLGVMMVFLSLGGALTNSINKGSKNHAWKKPTMITHGSGMFLSLLGGFGMLARYSIVSWPMPMWVMFKLAIWVLLGGAIAVIIRKPDYSKLLWWTTLLLGLCAATLGVTKPF